MQRTFLRFSLFSTTGTYFKVSNNTTLGKKLEETSETGKHDEKGQPARTSEHTSPHEYENYMRKQHIIRLNRLKSMAKFCHSAHRLVLQNCSRGSSFCLGTVRSRALSNLWIVSSHEVDSAFSDTCNLADVKRITMVHRDFRVDPFFHE